MVKHWLGMLLLCLVTTSCSGWNSELNTLAVDDINKNSKPICDFDTKNTCFSESVNLLMACMGPNEGASGQMLDEYVCSGQKGALVRFTNPLDMHYVEEGRPFEYTVYSGKKACFRFSGDRENFTVDSDELGILMVRKLSNGDTQVSCFNNKSFIIPAEVQSKGCRNQKTAIKDFFPKHDTGIKKKVKASGEVVFDHFQFSFLGTGTPSEPLVKCNL